MKKMQHAFIVLGIMILAASFFAACGDPDPVPTVPGVTYTLIIRNGNTISSPALDTVSIEQGKNHTISRTLTASDNSSTVGITFTYVCTTHASGCGVSVNPAGTQIQVAASATVGEHSFTASAEKSGTTVATANFTVTVTQSSYGIIINPNNMGVSHGAGEDGYLTIINATITAPNGATSGLTLSFVCTALDGDENHTACGLTFSGPNAQGRYSIGVVPNTVQLGEHSITATLLQNDQPLSPSVTAPLTVRVKPKYTLTTTQEQFRVVQGGHFDLDGKYTLSVSSGALESNIKIGFSCKTDYDFCPLFADFDGRDWADLAFDISDTAIIGNVHAMMLEAFADDGNGEQLAEKQFEILVRPKYILDITEEEFEVQPGDPVDLSDIYTVIASDDSTLTVGTVSGDGTITDGNIIVGVSCETHGDDCDLFDDHEYRWGLTFDVSDDATTDDHVMKLEVQDIYRETVAEGQFTIKVAE